MWLCHYAQADLVFKVYIVVHIFDRSYASYYVYGLEFVDILSGKSWNQELSGNSHFWYFHRVLPHNCEAYSCKDGRRSVMQREVYCSVSFSLQGLESRKVQPYKSGAVLPRTNWRCTAALHSSLFRQVLQVLDWESGDSENRAIPRSRRVSSRHCWFAIRIGDLESILCDSTLVRFDSLLCFSPQKNWRFQACNSGIMRFCAAKVLAKIRKEKTNQPGKHQNGYNGSQGTLGVLEEVPWTLLLVMADCEPRCIPWAHAPSNKLSAIHDHKRHKGYAAPTGALFCPEIHAFTGFGASFLKQFPKSLVTAKYYSNTKMAVDSHWWPLMAVFGR